MFCQTQRARRGETDTIEQSPANPGQRDLKKGTPAARAEGVRRLLRLDADFAQDGHNFTDGKRQRDKDGDEQHARHRKRNVKAGCRHERGEPPLPGCS